jgi:haloacetate dehalogenase
VHGHPETHVTWHKIASRLAEKYTVVLPDLRGYGDSSKPDGGDNHINYSFRAMALDQIEIAPTLTMYNDTNKEFATRYVWWFLQIQPEPMPEHLIGLDSAYYLREHLEVQGKTPGAVTPQAMAEYIRCYCCTDTIHAACEDYRAAATIDLDMDRTDDAAGRKIQAPVLALWGAKGTVGQMWDVLATWRSKAANQVTGKALPCGHLLPEEAPEQVLAEFRAFFEI